MTDKELINLVIQRNLERGKEALTADALVTLSCPGLCECTSDMDITPERCRMCWEKYAESHQKKMIRQATEHITIALNLLNKLK